jgi:membrane-associated phospholipid phosphatase
MARYFVVVIVFLQFIQYGYAQDSSSYSNSRLRIVNTDPDNCDVKLFRSINNNRSDFLEKGLTITDYSVLPAAVIIPGGLFWYGRSNHKNYDENTGVLVAFSEATSVALTAVIKYVVKRPRPYITLSNVHVKKGILSDPYSFPSGHTSTAFSIATELALRYTKYPQTYVPAYIWGLIVGYGRVYFGMHYPGDVLGGAVIGSLSAIGIYSLRTQILGFKNRVFGEENKPDVNEYNSKSIGLVAGGLILLSGLNELLLKNDNKIQMGFEPVTKEGHSGISCSIRYSF